MNEDHINAFVSESRESITDLNNALLELEDDPDNDESIESVFRTAHTLKGNFGAMGFSNASELAHVLEDLLDEIRDGNIDVTPEIMDAAFEGVDRIETIVNEVERDGESTTDPEATTGRLRSAINRATKETTDPTDEKGDNETSGENGETNDGSILEAAKRLQGIDDREAFVHARIGVDPDRILGVDAMLTLEQIEDAVETLSTVPPRDILEDGEYDGTFEVFVPGESVETLNGALETIGVVERFEVTEFAPAADSNGTERNAPAGRTRNSKAQKRDLSNDNAENIASNAGTEPEPKDEKTPQSRSTNDISSVRVDVNRLDELHGLVEQLVTGRITIRRAIESNDYEAAENGLNDFDKVTSRLQNTVMDMRLIPLQRVVSNLPRVVRDVSRSQQKAVSLEMYGQEIELDRSILTEIEDPLIHILRNAVDHGIEPPAERENAEKPREGTIELHASRQRDHVTISVSDDGGGIDPDAIRTKAVNEGVISESEAESVSDDEAYDLIFHPGFSTATEVTDVSGRGVGMDVVHSTVEQLDGTVNVESELGEGTTVELRLPVSVAIVNVLFVTVGEQEYGIPIKNIDELTPVETIETVGGEPVVRHNDDVYPVISLEETLTLGNALEETQAPVVADGGSPDGTESTMLVRIRKSVRPIALRCDSFNDQEEVVVKPLEGSLSGISGLSGTAILGDGNIVPILDVVSLGK